MVFKEDKGGNELNSSYVSIYCLHICNCMAPLKLIIFLTTNFSMYKHNNLYCHKNHKIYTKGE